VLYSIVLLFQSTLVPSTLLQFATTSQIIGIQQSMLPIATFLVSVCVKVFNLVPWFPFTHLVRNILLAVLAQSLVGVGMFSWASFVRHQLDSNHDEALDVPHLNNI